MAGNTAKKSTSNKTTARVLCKCASDFQDKTYGKGVRVANRTAKNYGESSDARCTVCGAVHQVSNVRFN
jgi:hypothetical protein